MPSDLLRSAASLVPLDYFRQLAERGGIELTPTDGHFIGLLMLEVSEARIANELDRTLAALDERRAALIAAVARVGVPR